MSASIRIVVLVALLCCFLANGERGLRRTQLQRGLAGKDDEETAIESKKDSEPASGKGGSEPASGKGGSDEEQSSSKKEKLYPPPEKRYYEYVKSEYDIVLDRFEMVPTDNEFVLGNYSWWNEIPSVPHEWDYAIQKARKRLERIIVGDVPDEANPNGVELYGELNGIRRVIPGLPFANQALFPPFPDLYTPYTGPVDDIRIAYFWWPSLHGELFQKFSSNQTLGSAQVIFLRNSTNCTQRPVPATCDVRPVSAAMYFNIDAIQALFDSGDFTLTDLYLLALHEMTHAVGMERMAALGTCFLECRFPSTVDRLSSIYTCGNATLQYMNSKLIPLAERNFLPPEMESGVGGSDCNHWTEDTFRVDGVTSEVMTPLFEEGVKQPYSAATIGGLEDIKYEVNYKQADRFPPEALYSEPHGEYSTYRRALQEEVDDIPVPTSTWTPGEIGEMWADFEPFDLASPGSNHGGIFANDISI